MNQILAAALSVNNPKFRGLVVFKTLERLNAANANVADALLSFGGQYSVDRREWTFPSGATVKLGLAEPMQYIGMEFSSIKLYEGVPDHVIYHLIERKTV